MTAQKKRRPRDPTNAEIMEILRPLVDDVAILKQWKRDQEIAKSAVAEYVKENRNQEPPELKGSEQWLNRELVKTLALAMGVIAALVALLK